MKNKLTVALFSLCLLAGTSAYAQEEQKGDRLAEFKSEVIGDLNKEKAIIDTAISCINSASKKDDMQKCHEQKRASMDSLRQARETAQKQRMAKRKEMLQKEMNDLDSKMNQKSSTQATQGQNQ